MRKNLLGWLGWAGLDILVRLTLLTGSTAVFSRLLDPHDFGVTALVLIIVTVASVFVGTPFEDALAQRDVLRRADIEAALAAAWLTGLALLALSIPGGVLLAKFYREPTIAVLLPVATCSVFFSGHSDIMTGIARRLRRFNQVAVASLAGHAVGIALALILALLGFGLWALIAQRLLVVVARTILLQWQMRILIVPRWSSTHLYALGRFAGFSLLDRLAENANYLAFNSIVGAVYGLTALGYVNMAMRLVEPIRGAFIATGHNVAFSYFAAAQGDAAGLVTRAHLVLSRAALVIAPTFAGLAAVMPVLLPLVAGPGWLPAVPIAILLALGSAVILPARLIFAAFSAAAHPEFSLLANAASVVGTLTTLFICAPLGPISIGLSRVVGDTMQAACAIVLAPAFFRWPPSKRLGALVPAWLLAASMAGAVAVVIALMPGIARGTLLGLAVVAGLISYAGLLHAFARSDLDGLIALLWPREKLQAETDR